MTDGPALDRARIVEVLDRHGVEANLARLASALRELRAFLRVGGLTDDEARALPMQLDAAALGPLDVSTWRTDAGDLDVLVHLRRRDGQPMNYDNMLTRAKAVELEGFTVRLAALDDIIASKEFADRPKDREALDELRRLAEDQP